MSAAPVRPVLVLGGTAEARELAALLVADGVDVVSSLAGRVARPRLPVGPVRIGGFGGVDGLVGYLQDHQVRAIVDATHPFAEGMSRNALAAALATDTALLRLERPGWGDRPEAAGWRWVDSHAEAAALAAHLGSRPLLTVGRQSLTHFVEPLAAADAVVRVVDPPTIEVPASWTVLTSRGPYTVAGETALITANRCDVVVTKDSGGSYTWPKLEVAEILGVAVVVVRRAAGPAGVVTVHDAQAAATWVRELSLAPGQPG